MKSVSYKLAWLSLIAASLVVVTSCSKQQDDSANDNPALASPVPEGMVRGTVVESMDAGGYTYVLLDTTDGQRWVASQPADVAVGDLVQTTVGMPMQQFKSNSLNRTFDLIYFTGTLQNLSVAARPESQPAAALPEGHPSVAAQANASGEATADVDVAAIENGKDIAWIHANKDSLVGREISLRGKVVKYNANILGANFLHIQDGSGVASDGSNDLTVTSSMEAAVGQTVVVTGNIILDKDFGAGYSFPVMMEDASISVEE